MADDKQGRDKQAHDAERRQRERELRTELERRNEPEPPVDEADLDGIDAALEDVPFPATGADVVDAIGDRSVAAGGDRYAVKALIAESDVERFERPEIVRVRVRRPRVASAMKQVVEAAETIPNVEFPAKTRDAYEKSLRAMAAIDADDEDSGVRALREWVVDRIEEKGKLPRSRDVRRQGAKIARKHGHEIRNDDWLGV
ncbi:hypothetical protein B4589_000945 [Halolamina sp. CBA1230]|uniref:hypothetical protein n=1 Tax=Halolamina sp. CBA1230 TaxID=1853690 RepID=UPI0009A175C3|nr:hypothetical protein [Halolamina sp. CBA1230]QKY19007.1 hypothetical protein B4589_000945 [Halolamina sp. CBA1230]